jgi:hypothetical protein
MMASGVEAWRAKVMYAAVFHFGPRWPRTVTVSVPENEVGAAQSRALAQAEPGSDAMVVRVRPQPVPPPAPGAAPSPAPAPAAPQSGPRREAVDVQIEPPPQTLTQQDFENLKKRIIDAETKGPRKMARTRSFSTPNSSSADESAAGDGERTSGLQHNGGGAGPGGRAGVSLLDIRSFKTEK